MYDDLEHGAARKTEISAVDKESEMKLTGLIPLYKSMRSKNLDRTKFRYQHNDLLFDCLFFIDTKPFELAMGCVSHNFAIYLEVRDGFEITPFIEPREVYLALLQALIEGKRSGHSFDPKEFFNEFNRKIPQHARPEDTPTPSDLVRVYPHIEESKKIHFCGWFDNNKVGKHVQPSNLDKTRRFFGQRSYDFSLRRNMSTKWTDDPNKAIDYHMP